jgi:hypothetical protein
VRYLAAIPVAVISGVLAYLAVTVVVGLGFAKVIALVFAGFVWCIFAWAFSP